MPMEIQRGDITPTSLAIDLVENYGYSQAIDASEGFQSPTAIRNTQFIRAYASGVAGTEEVVRALRRAYIQRLLEIEKTPADKTSQKENDIASYLREILSQSDAFFAAALRKAKPVFEPKYSLR